MNSTYFLGKQYDFFCVFTLGPLLFFPPEWKISLDGFCHFHSYFRYFLFNCLIRNMWGMIFKNLHFQTFIFYSLKNIVEELRYVTSPLRWSRTPTKTISTNIVQTTGLHLERVSVIGVCHMHLTYNFCTWQFKICP